MSDNKLPDYLLNVEDLLKLADKTSKTSESIEVFDPFVAEIKRFINENGLTFRKENPIPVQIVYDLYHQWSKHPLPQKVFNEYFKQFFNMYRLVGHFCYKIDATKFGLPETYSIYKDPRYIAGLKGRRTCDKIGVYLLPGGLYHARLKTDAGTIFIGCYMDEHIAVESYDIEAVRYYGEEAKINHPDRLKEYQDRIKGGQETIQQKRKVSSFKSKVPNDS